jgi:hypothetical protein
LENNLASRLATIRQQHQMAKQEQSFIAAKGKHFTKKICSVSVSRTELKNKVSLQQRVNILPKRNQFSFRFSYQY